MNVAKSSIFFSKNVKPEAVKDITKHLLNMKVVKQGKYLGLPMVVTRLKEEVFGYVRDKVKKRVRGWKEKLLSPIVKEVLLKSVIMVLPTYTMSCFKLSKKLCKEISALMANFWRGKGGEGNHPSLVNTR